MSGGLITEGVQNMTIHNGLKRTNFGDILLTGCCANAVDYYIQCFDCLPFCITANTQDIKRILEKENPQEIARYSFHKKK